MKVRLATEIRQGPYGGGNQFLRGLAQAFRELGILAESPAEAPDILLVNSYQDLSTALDLKRRYPGAFVVHRLGPVFSLHRKPHWARVDRLMIRFAEDVADLVIFQSEWSRNEHEKRGYREQVTPSVIIGNAPQEIFFSRIEPRESRGAGAKTRLLASSWSMNPKKGFGYLQYLDENLDFARWELSFIGNTEMPFKNIQCLPPAPSPELARKLQAGDLFFFGGEDDACSNMLLEALASGLPVLALQSGGNPELLGNGGELFKTRSEIIPKLEAMRAGLDHYRERIQVPRMQDIALSYQNAFGALIEGKRSPKRLPSLLPIRVDAQLGWVQLRDYMAAKTP